MKKTIGFWELNLNSITMFKNLKPPKKEAILKTEVRKKDQASVFKPKGFR